MKNKKNKTVFTVYFLKRVAKLAREIAKKEGVSFKNLV